jgi:hypothetical protein
VQKTYTKVEASFTHAFAEVLSIGLQFITKGGAEKQGKIKILLQDMTQGNAYSFIIRSKAAAAEDVTAGARVLENKSRRIKSIKQCV